MSDTARPKEQWVRDMEYKSWELIGEDTQGVQYYVNAFPKRVSLIARWQPKKGNGTWKVKTITDYYHSPVTPHPVADAREAARFKIRVREPRNLD